MNFTFADVLVEYTRWLQDNGCADGHNPDDPEDIIEDDPHTLVAEFMEQRRR